MNEHTNQKKKDAGTVYDIDILILSEVKCGPYARPTTNQKKVLIPILKGGEHPVIYPKGKNAAKIPEFKNVMINNAPYTGNYGVEIIHYDPPILH